MGDNDAAVMAGSDPAVAELISGLASPVLTAAWEPDPSPMSVSTKTKAGGAPYRERGEDWPVCRVCAQPVEFTAQIRQPDGALIVVYECHRQHEWPLPDGVWDLFRVRVYLTPSQERAVSGAPPIESKVVPSRLGPTWQAWSLPQFDQLPGETQSRLLHLCNPYVDSPDELAAVYRDLAHAEMTRLRESGVRVFNIDASDQQFWELDQAIGLGASVVAEPCPQCERPMRLCQMLDFSNDLSLYWDGGYPVSIQRCQEHSDEFTVQSEKN